MSEQPWTDKQLKALYRKWQGKMRKANWKNGGQGCWIHQDTGAKFYAWTVTKWRKDKYPTGEAWYPFALDNETPTEAPF